MSQVEGAARAIAASMDRYKVIVNKSTVPVGTGSFVREVIEQNRRRNVDFDVVSNPEFLREGSAIQDAFNPDRIVVGAPNQNVAMKIIELYAPLERPMIITDVASAEIIKYACIFDAALYKELQHNNLLYYKENKEALLALIQRCIALKNNTVLEDEKEKGIRKLLNFGHTAGHAIETLYNLPHGQAVSLGMLIACKVSERVCGLNPAIKESLSQLLLQYKLPVSLRLHPEQLMDVLVMDKKRSGDFIDYVLLNDIGSAFIKPIPFEIIQTALEDF
jgi:hypothetical protein